MEDNFSAVVIKHGQGFICVCMWCVCVCVFRVQDQVSGVIDVMKTNIGKVMQRGEKLEDLEEKSGELP